jgi:DNA-directed RNA polymerase specialized sigma24 family protein
MATEDDFASFHASIFARLVGQVTLVTGDRHEAEDVVQVALAQASVRCRGCAATTCPRPGCAGWR